MPLQDPLYRVDNLLAQLKQFVCRNGGPAARARTGTVLGRFHVGGGTDSFAEQPGFVVETTGIRQTARLTQAQSEPQALTGVQFLPGAVPGDSYPLYRSIVGREDEAPVFT